MKTLLLCICLFFSVNFLQAQPYVHIPDDMFRLYLDFTYPGLISGDSMDLSNTQLPLIEDLIIQQFSINDISGIEYFTALKHLDIRINSISSITALPQGLETFLASYNNFSTLNILPNSLKILHLDANPLTQINFPDSLEVLKIDGTNLSNIELSPVLRELVASDIISPVFLDPFPSTLTDLDISYTQLDTLQALPSGLLNFNCEGNLFTTVMPFPSGIRQINFSFNNISGFPDLSNLLSLSILNISYNTGINSLPILPDSLQALQAYGCSLTNWIQYTANTQLKHLDLSNNNIDSIPDFPTLLTHLYINQNNYSELPALPYNLKLLSCGGSPLTETGPLPSGIEEIDVSGTQISCLPFLPPGLEILNYTNSGIICLPNLPPFLSGNHTICSEIASGCPTYISLINGYTYFDLNGNGNLDSTESKTGTIGINANPGISVSTDSNGYFRIPLDTLVTYTIQPDSIPYYNQTNLPLTISFPSAGIVSGPHNFGFIPSGNVNDLVLTLVSINPPVPGFPYPVKIDYYNKGTTTLMADLKLVLNTDVSFVSSTPVNSGSNADTISWSLGTLTPFQRGSIEVDLLMDVNAVLGNQNCISATLSPLAGDSVPSDNTYQLCQEIIGSFDPNDKAVTPEGNFSPAQVANGDYLEYKIRFQNTGTADAINIEVRDTLSTLLDPSTFEFISSSHPTVWTLNNNALLFRFANIHLPDSNANEPESHGFVVFKIKPYPTIQLNDVIENTAAIYFDFNAPVITNTTSTVIANPVGISELTEEGISVYPNPASGSVTFLINFDSPITKGNLFISDMLGRVLIEEEYYSKQITKDLSGILSGVYFYTITGKESTYTGKLIIR